MPRLESADEQSLFISPPMVGGILCLAASQTEVDIDLTKVAGLPANTAQQGYDAYNPCPIGHYLSLQADGADIYVAFAQKLSQLGSLSTTAVTTVASNVPSATNTATGVFKIPSGTTMPVKLPVGPAPGTGSPDLGINSFCRYLGFLCASGNSGTLRIYQSSP